MSTHETEFPDCSEKVGLKRKLTGPPRLLLGKSKSKERLEGKSQRRQRQVKCDGTVENNDQENSNGKDNEPSLITHHSPQKASGERETSTDSPGDTSGILVTLEESESKGENIESKMEMTRKTSKISIKRTFSSLFRCGKRKESDRTVNKNNSQHNMCNSVCENKLSNANNKEVPNGKRKKKVFFTVWPISKKSATSNVSLGRGCKEQGGGMVFQEITAPKDLTFKKIYCIFPRRKKAHPIDQFECSAHNPTQKEVADQLNQSPAAVMDIPCIKTEDNQKEEQEIQAESIPETFTFSADVSITMESDMDKEKLMCPDQDVSLNEEEDQVLQTSGILDSAVPQSCCSGCSFDSEFPATSPGSDLLVLNKETIENDTKCRPVITIEHAYLSEEENMYEAPQFDDLIMNGSWQHLKITNTLHPSDLNVPTEYDHGRCNETLLIQTAISMVRAAIRGAVEQLTVEQQHNQISLDHA
ncbi:uncharacterized protein LOC143728756 [Siphateles boraxobius]|uniref:uncharacterized protein LOC143728756 n=1 Tax=Siphateles boraxobius TaxID=180520 RepID=UPI0040649BC6